ncbi:hypothetical protein V6N13_033828 [Hibiscus sabdariffa]|uniref:Uncharacterized protein n=1 Tax=Hibiscus sabdariffa TaxID=183260 RepID=A0ABR2F9G4_9ROSI
MFRQWTLGLVQGPRATVTSDHGGVVVLTRSLCHGDSVMVVEESVNDGGCLERMVVGWGVVKSWPRDECWLEAA